MEKQIYNIDEFLASFSDAQGQVIKRALSFVEQIEGSARYTEKSIEVALILKVLNVDTDTVAAAILSAPCIPLTAFSHDIAEQFGQPVALLVKDVNSLNQLQLYSTAMANQPTQAEILRRMLLSMIEDVRAVLIKLAYRIYRLRHLAAEDYDLRRFIARETLDIYASIANRLGVSQLKWELEDLAFRYLYPQQYLKLVKSLDATRIQREQVINSFKETLLTTLQQENICAEIAGRPKHIYSIWKKMQNKGVEEVDELYDLLAVRVIVKELSSCYAVLGIVHGEWQSIPKEFDDYISNPKGNGYQSLHTVIVTPEGHRIEVQIRTQDMHEFAELGVAAHWRYKEGSKQNAATEKNIAALRQLLSEKGGDEEFVENFKTELFEDRVYVLTPKAKLLELTKGSTPLDFAYAIHTEIGHRCRGAKVNGRIVPLTYILKSGEQIEILTAKEGEPNHHWIDFNLGYLKSAHAIHKVKSWFKHQNDEKNILSGKAILGKESKLAGVEGANLAKIAAYFKKPNIEQVYLAIGRGEINTNQLAGYFKKTDIEKPKFVKVSNKPGKSSVLIDGMSNVASSIAQCCHPGPGDDIIGYISHYRGITIHKQACDNIKYLSRQQQTQLIQASWKNANEI